MSKRFIDTNIFDDSWFMGLSPNAKVLWIYSITKCNHAGILDFNYKLCEFVTGISLNLEIEEIGDKWNWFKEDTIFITKFVEFQYGELQEKNRVHASVINILKKEGLYKPLISPLQGVKDKDKDKVKDKVKDKDKVIKKEKIKHLDYVFLTSDEKIKLHGKFGIHGTMSRIENLNNYLGSTGKKYKSHYHTILNWESKNNASQPKDQPKAEPGKYANVPVIIINNDE